MTTYGRDSLWKDTAGIDLAKARELVAKLEKRAEGRDEIEARAAYLILLGVAEGDRVLDVGCGSGVVTRAIARKIGARGRVIGLDPSASFLTVAREIADQTDVAARIEFREGSASAPPFADGSFDAAIAVTVLAHMHNGAAAVPELARVVRPGGRIGIFDFDADMTVFTHPDREMTRRIVSSAADAVAVDGWIARRMPALLAAAGIRDVQVRGFFPIDSDPNGFYVNLAERSSTAAATSGAVTADEAREWLETFRAQLADGPVVAGRLHLFVWGRKA
jgi:SAM-dependent methyltransferase